MLQDHSDNFSAIFCFNSCSDSALIIVLNSYITISRNRNTGVSIVYNGTVYNIDIDFLWGAYLNTFKEQEKIVVSGNRMIYQLFLVSVLEKCLSPQNKTI